MYKKTALLSSLFIAFSAFSAVAFADDGSVLHADNKAVSVNPVINIGKHASSSTTSVSTIDPFTGKIGKYEHYVAQYNTSSILKKIKKNDLEIARINHQMSALGGNASSSSMAGPHHGKSDDAENAMLLRQVSALRQQVSGLHAQFVAAEQAVAKKRAMDNAPRLVAIMGDSGDRSALIRIGHKVHSFRSNTTFGEYRVGKVGNDGVMVYGPSGGHYIRLSQVGAIGVIDAAAPMTKSQYGGGTGGTPMAGNTPNSAINARLLQESGVHVLPPRPGMPGKFGRFVR